MANSRTSADYREQATVDTAPASGGYFTNAINPKQLNKGTTNKGARVIYFSVRGTGQMTVTLQFRPIGETTWTDFATFKRPVQQILEDERSGTRWRIGVKQGARVSGSLTVGFNW